MLPPLLVPAELNLNKVKADAVWECNVKLKAEKENQDVS